MTTCTLTADLPYGADPRQRLDVVSPDHIRGPLLILLHGGWWVRGHRRDLLSCAVELASSGMPVATLGYRLLQGSRNRSDLVADICAGTAAALEEHHLLGGRSQEVVLIGSGAGGLLALAAAHACAEHPAMSLRGVVVAGTAPGVTPWPGCPEAVAEHLAHFARGDEPALPMDQLPPVLLMHGDSDDEVPVHLAKDLHSQLLDHHCVSTLAILAGAGHRFLEDPNCSFGRSAINRISDWIGRLDDLDDQPQDASDIIIGEPAWLR